MLADDEITRPEKIQKDHNLEGFSSGEPSLDEWLRKRAIRNEDTGASRTYVICREGRVVGYYTLAAGAVERATAPGKVRQNMPDPIPVMIICCLAVDQKYQGCGMGSGLLRDAVLRIIEAGDIVGVRAILIHALKDAKNFYEHCGFGVPSVGSRTLMVTVADAAKALNIGKGPLKP